MLLSPRPRGESWSALSGDFAGRHLVGGPARPGWFRAGLSQAGRCCSGRRLQSEPHCDGRLRPIDKQYQMGESPRKRVAPVANDRFAEGFRRQRLPDCEPGQDTAHATRWKTPPVTACIGTVGNRRGSWTISDVPLRFTGGPTTPPSPSASLSTSPPSPRISRCSPRGRSPRLAFRRPRSAPRPGG